MTTEKQPVLCYVDDNWAYFTTAPLSQQTGDDWNDAPYEHNAGEPDEYNAKFDGKRGREPWEIVKVVWDGDFKTPNYAHGNSPWTVDAINAGAIAWLATPAYSSAPTTVIPAGTPLDKFIELVHRGGGEVYLKAPKS